MFGKLKYQFKKKFYNSKIREKIYRVQARRKLKNKNFSLICNNCWAWSVYEDLNIEYTTPTVGLYFFAHCYIAFLKNIFYYLSLELKFKNDSFYAIGNERIAKRSIKYPIGVLDDIEIHFLHYKTEEEAKEKWERRKSRINFNNLFISFSDTDLCTYELIKEFDALPFENKIFFGAKNYPGIQSIVWLKNYANHDSIGDISTHRWAYRKYFDVIKWLNKG